MTPALEGRQFRAMRRLSTKADVTLADVGETCERVPAASLPWLLEQGLIAPVEPAPGKAPRKART